MINYKLSKLSKLNYNNLKYKLPNDPLKDISLMLLNYANLDCLNISEKRKYEDIVEKFTFDCISPEPEILVDSTFKEDWEIANPNCVNRKRWEKIAYKICAKYNLVVDINKIEAVCSLAFDIVKNTIHCDVLTSISIQQKMCDLNLEVNRSKAECDVDYKLLIEKHPNCNLTKREYIYLVENNYSFEIISNTYEHDLKFEVDSKGNIKLISPTYSYILPSELRFKDVVVNKNSNSLILLDKQLKEYNINNNIKKLILDGKYYI